MKFKRVPTNPVLSISTLLRRTQKELPAPFDKSSVIFFSYGRLALFEGLKILGIKSGENVLLPSYICNAVISPFNQLGIEVKFYDIDAELFPDFDSAKKQRDKKTRAFLAVNYFGFPQDMKEIQRFCQNHHLAFIEDNAHGFLSALEDRPLGTFGDIGIFSFRKTLPVPNGAALIINNKNLAIPKDLEGNSNFDALRIAPFLARNSIRNLEKLMGFSLTEFLKKFYPVSTLRDQHYGDEENNLPKYFENYSNFSHAILSRTDMEKIKQIRKEAYIFWRDYFNDHYVDECELLFKNLPLGAVPYIFPILARNRKQLMEQMLTTGIECFPWPDPPQKAPVTRFTQELLAIPVHTLPIMDKEGLK